MIFAAAFGLLNMLSSVFELYIRANISLSVLCKPIGAAFGMPSGDSVVRIISDIPSTMPNWSVSIRISSPQRAKQTGLR